MKSNNNENHGNACHFTIEDIEEMATDRSFERGEELYFSDAVRNITKKGNHYYGEVIGSRPYNVFLIDDEDDLQMGCTCPYDFGGICKHLVAFALEILDGEFEEIPEMAPYNDDDFKQKYSEIDTDKKLRFLEQLLDRDNDLKQQFIAFSESETAQLDSIIGENVDAVKTDIHTALSNLNFDDLPYYDDYEYGYYREQWEVEYDAAIGLIKSVFDPCIKSITTYLKKGNLLDAFRILLGLYEGTQNLPDLDNDNYVFDGTYNDVVENILQEYFQNITKNISTVIKSDKAVKDVISLIFDRISHYKNQKTNKESVFYAIKDFEAIFQSLVTGKEIALFLHQKIQENQLESISSAFILLHIADVLQDEKLWIDTAEAYAKHDAKISKQLLKKYRLKNQPPDFNRIAKMAFDNWPYEFDKYLIDNLDKDQQKELYVKALKHYVSRSSSISHYKILKNYLTKDETIAFVNRFKNRKVFYVQMLEIEKRYEEILACVKDDIYCYDIEKLLKPILNIYPDDCFEIIVKINQKAMQDPKRNRSTYQTMVKTLKLLKKIASKKREAEAFLQSLYNHKPNLPALKDEMRKANLI